MQRELAVRTTSPLYFALFIIWASVACYLALPDPQGTDFYPIWSCSKAVILGLDPYSKAVSNQLSETWEVVRQRHSAVAPVCAYPLPFYLITAPFGLLPLGLSAGLWFALSLAAPLVFLLFADKRPLAPLVPLAFYPLFHGIVLKTSSVVWVCIFAVAAYLLLRRRFVLAALLAAVASTKPQIGGILFVYSLLSFFSREGGSRALPILALCSPWMVSWLYDPTWLERWIVALKAYESSAISLPLLPWQILVPVGVYSLLVFSRISPVAAIAAAQFLVFPVNDLYSSLPLMLCWIFIEPPQFILILFAAIIPITFSVTNQAQALQLSIFLPLLIAAVLQISKRQSDGLK